MIEFRHGKEANIGNVKDTDGIIVTSDTNRLFVLVNGKRYQVSDAIKVESSISVSNLIEGKMYYETDTNKLFYYNGTSKIYTGDSSGSGSEGSITIDTELSSTSTNAVQNKAIKAALDKKVDAVSGKGLSTNDYTNDEKAKVANFTVDSELSDSSTHAIQNKIVKEAIDELKASIGSGGTGGSSGSVSLGNPDQGTTVNGSSIKLNADTVTFTKDTVTTRDAYIPSSAAIRFGTTTSTSYTSMALEYVGGSSLGLAISMNGSKYVTIYNNHHNPIFRISEADSTVSFGLGGYTVNISGTSINLSGSINSGSITSDSVITASCFKATESADMSKFHDVSCDKLEATEATLNGECTINNDCHISGWTRVGNDLDVTGDFTAEGSASCTGLSAYSSTNSNVPLLSVGLDSSVYIGRKQQVSGGACMVSSTTICGTLAIESSAYLSSYSTSISYYDINTGNVNCSNYLRTSEIDGAGSTSCITFWTKSNAPGIYYDSAGKIGFAIGCTGGTATYSLGVILEASIGNCFRPNGDGNISLGSPDYRWATIFSSSSSISTSDRNEKNSIKDIDEETAVLLVEGLKPSTYKFNDSNSDRTHYGFIAQDIEELINSLGIDTKDFAAVCKDVKKQEVDVLETIEYKELDEETGEVTIKTKQEPTKKLVEVVADDGETQYMYGLRYEELIAPIVSHAQYLYKKTEALEKENSELKSTLASVLERLDKLESN